MKRRSFLIGATAFVLYRTTLGIKIRALLQNKEMASLLGRPPEKQ